jgi:transcriptional regulator with XRE-family HTH domain
METPRPAMTGGFGDLLRHWRVRRRLSQLDLAGEAGISSRHLSFVETGRAQPSREMVLILARALDVPLRSRNDLLTAAGYAAMYRESGFDAPAMAQARRALDFMASGFGGAEARALLEELLAYPDAPRQWRTLDVEASTAPFLPIEFRKGDLTLRYLTTLTSLGTPHDITLQELRIESFFPADEATEEATRRLAS